MDLLRYKFWLIYVGNLNEGIFYIVYRISFCHMIILAVRFIFQKMGMEPIRVGICNRKFKQLISTAVTTYLFVFFWLLTCS